MSVDRRQFLFFLGASAGAMALSAVPGCTATATVAGNSRSKMEFVPGETGPFELPPLPYDYDALEPYIDAETMRFHHDKHHAGYTRNLNAAVSSYPELQEKSAEELLRNIESIPEEIRKTVRQNGGGYVNHKMFWEIMSPDGGGEPTGAIAAAIDDRFGSFEAFKEEFEAAGKNRFGSGWAWLVLKDGNLEVVNTLNQNSPLMDGNYPIMGNDVWEHAYYLKYRNDRGEYLRQWWNVVNWEEIDRRYEMALS